MNRIDKQMAEYIHLSKYSRWIEEDNRRETWDETVDRLHGFWSHRISGPQSDLLETIDALRDKEAMPSMRTMMTAGKALERDNIAGFNCAGIAVNHPRVFDEIFYLLMCGSGVGFSVERQYTNRLPEVAEAIHDSDTTIKIRDSKIGWSKGLKELIALLYNGDCPSWDLTLVRPAGERLRTFGGRASGPLPLDNLFKHTVRLFKNAVGRKLSSLECHDLVCKIADTVIVGSVRRSACISLSNLTDDRMRRAKMGDWWNMFPYRALANNSIAFTEKPDMESYTKEFRAIYQSKAGERGIINKEALRSKAESCGREYDGDYILNPCGEAILRDSGGVCNLSEIVARPSDSLLDLRRKAISATIFGTLQSSLTDFRYLRKIWTKNQIEERLLGVSLTGIMDHSVLSWQKTHFSIPQGTPIKTEEELTFYKELGAQSIRQIGDQTVEEVFIYLEDALEYLKNIVRETNIKWAKILGIEPSLQLTLIKPSGTVSQLCGTSSGIHPRFAPYYIRRVTQDIKDPLTSLMVEEGVPYVIAGEKAIFSFPIKSPEGAVCARDMGAMEQLGLWELYRDHWCDGNPSQTIYYTDSDFLNIQAWVYNKWDKIGGLSFFPLDDNVYENAPYEEISEEKYEELALQFPDIDWSKLPEFEKEDGTCVNTEFACAGGQCDF